MKPAKEYASSALNPNNTTVTRSSSTNYTPLPVSLSRLPVPRPLKRSSSPELSVDDYENYFYSNSQPSTPSPSKYGKVSEIVKQRLYSLTPSPLKMRSAVIGGIFSSSSAAQTTRQTSAGGSSSSLNAYGIIRSNSSPNRLDTQNANSSNANRRKSNLNSNITERIKVCVRKRPLSQREVQANHHDILELTNHCVAVLEDRVRLDGISRYTEKHEFIFDRVFDVNSTNRQIYAASVQELVDTVISGGRATCFAYGQTGSGKTHTMLNPDDGLNHLAAYDLFQQTATHLSDITIHVTFYEIYQNSLYDLLNQKRRVMACEGRNGEVHIVGITEIPVRSADHLEQIMQEALNTRSTGSTAANSTSSRSHAILQFILRKKSCGGIHGKFSFIDLAGSERGSDRANVDKQTKLEGAEINKSLLALKECIRAIDQDSSHLPFRQSKLTLVLKDSFTGNAKTCMIATVSPSSANCEHTINTLRYADRVKELKGSNGGLVTFEDCSEMEIREIPSPMAPPPSTIKAAPIKYEEYVLDEDLMDEADNLLQSSSSPLKLTESDDSFLLSTFPVPPSSSQPFSVTKSKSSCKLKESLHHSIAVLYDRVSNCHDSDLLELLGEEIDGLLAAFNK